ncbi:substrate-binding domain-containing protein [Sorangium sp. So ce136]|uniref:substrate-binding domain-containing protein n=1 Tax=Sorangium sp. So ce136 TaxID=3133284 RepID=UPI003F0751F6
MHTVLRWSVALAFTLGSVACGDNPAEEPITIAWMSKAADNPFFDLSRQAALVAGRDLTGASGREVRVQLLEPASADAQLQAAKIREAIDMNVDAINLSVLDPPSATPLINEAAARGIPTITFDSDAPDSDRVTYYGIDTIDASTMAAKLLAKLMGYSGQVAIMTSEDTSGAYIERINAFKNEIGKHDSLAISTSVVCGPVEVMEKAGCTQLLEEVTEAHPEIKGWYLARGRVLRELDLAQKAPRWSARQRSGEIVSVGFDVTDTSLPNLKNGLTNVLIGQKLFGWGYDVVLMTFDMLTTDRRFEPFFNSGFDVVCGDNVDEAIANWKAQDFRRGLTACELLSESN